jgi:secondary thiamine-phosphate synthase enzyme
MKVIESELRVATDGDGTIIDLTSDIERAVRESGIETGQLTVFVPGSTGAVTTVEYEPGLLADLPELFEKLIPKGKRYRHDARWGDGNGFSHLRASLVGPSLTIPVSGCGPTLGTWQQVIFLEFDNKPRSRTLVLSILGE